MNIRTPYILPQKIALLLLGWLFILSSSLSYSQTQNDTLVAYKHFKKADSLLTYRNLDSAIVYFKKALPIYQNTKNWERVARCYNKISESQWHEHKYEESLKTAKKALEICHKYLPKNNREEATAYNNIGNYYKGSNFTVYQTDYKIATAYFKKSFDILIKKFGKKPVYEANFYHNVGETFFFQYEYKKALKYYKKSLLLIEKSFEDYSLEIANIGEDIGFTYYKMREYDKALPHLTKALTIYKERLGKSHIQTGVIFNILGIIYRRKGEYKTAILNLENSLSIFTQTNEKKYYKISRILNSIGVCHKSLGEYDKALYFYNIALKTLNKSKSKKVKNPSNIYNNIGVVYKYKGEYDKALSYLKKALLYSTIKVNEMRTPGRVQKFNQKKALNFNNIANIHRLKREYKKAFTYYEKALNIRKEIFNKKYSDIADSYNDLGKTYHSSKRYNCALFYYQKALEIRKELFKNIHPDIANSYDNLGRVYFSKKEYSTALTNYQKALEIQQQIFGDHHPKIGASYTNLAQLYIAKNEYQTSLEYFDKAIKANTNPQKQNSTSIDQYFDLNIVLSSLQGKAKVYNLLYAQDHNPDHLAKAIAIYQEADRIIDHIRGTYTSYQDKVAFAQKAKNIYKGAIATQLQVYELQKDQKALAHAFYYAEKSKANTLKELLNSTSAKKIAGLPNTTTTLEKQLRVDRAFYQSQITKEYAKQKRDTTKITRYENELFTVTEQQDSLTKVIETTYPKYHELTYNKEIVSLTKIQQQLQDSTTVVEFLPQIVSRMRLRFLNSLQQYKN